MGHHSWCLRPPTRCYCLCCVVWFVFWTELCSLLVCCLLCIVCFVCCVSFRVSCVLFIVFVFGVVCVVRALIWGVDEVGNTVLLDIGCNGYVTLSGHGHPGKTDPIPNIIATHKTGYNLVYIWISDTPWGHWAQPLE